MSRTGVWSGNVLLIPIVIIGHHKSKNYYPLTVLRETVWWKAYLNIWCGI